MAPPTYFISGPLAPALYTEQEIKTMIYEVYLSLYEYNSFRAVSFVNNIVYAIAHTAAIATETKAKLLGQMRSALAEINAGRYQHAHNNVRDAYYLLCSFD